MTQQSPIKFVLVFISVYLILTGLHHVITGSAIEGGYIHSSFIQQHLNYQDLAREVTLKASRILLKLFGVSSEIYDKYYLLTENGAGVRMIYSCIGFSIYILWISFITTYPINYITRIVFLPVGILTIFVLNVIRVSLLVGAKFKFQYWIIDNHTVYNILVYAVLSMLAYKIVNYSDLKKNNVRIGNKTRK